MRPRTVGLPIIPDPLFINLPFSSYALTLLLVQNVAAVLSDILAFLTVICQVWGLWKENRRLRLQAGKDFATLLLRQGILRFLLSAIFICEFTLDLRRRNTTARSLPNPSALELELPDLNLSSQDNSVIRSIQSVFSHLQERMIADMGERSNSVSIEGPGQLEGEPDSETA
ncbi:hypothetical protein Clacol_004675 [Clathrus columnatus]|uniref:Uncharacterized protein n=1 Tax=Clathrus columnatus TaxID=1419009 RepID=A0AAV5ACL1_9AGAM|nr:hypothetical protein Clacol_004675 [Clathrus columnatus]